MDGSVLERHTQLLAHRDNAPGRPVPDGEVSGAAPHGATRTTLLSEVALALAAADSLDALERVAIGRGRRLFDADGAVFTSATVEGDWRITDSGTLGSRGEQGPVRSGCAPRDSGHPACRVAREGRRLLVPGRECVVGRDLGAASRPVADEQQSWVILPLLVGDECLGSVALSWRDQRRLDPDTAELLGGFAAQCAQTLARLRSRDAERAHALAVAVAHRQLTGALQRSSSTTMAAQPDRVEVAARTVPADRDAGVGGDWHDAFTTGEGVVTLVIGDVAGHDRDAVAGMTQARNLLRGIGHAVDATPARVLERLDQALEGLGVDVLATTVLAQLDPAPSSDDPSDDPSGAPGGQVLRWSSAGHLPPLLLHPDGRAELLRTPADLLLGCDPRIPRADHRRELAPGSTVLLFTDGLVERRGADLDDGLAWLAAAVEERAGLDPDGLLDALIGLVGDVEDDVCLLALRTAGATAPPAGRIPTASGAPSAGASPSVARRTRADRGEREGDAPVPLTLAVEQRAGTWRVELTGDLDEASAPLVTTVLDALVAAGAGRLRVDAAGVDVVDQAGVDALLDAVASARGQGADLVVTGASADLARRWCLAHLERDTAGEGARHP